MKKKDLIKFCETPRTMGAIRAQFPKTSKGSIAVSVSVALKQGELTKYKDTCRACGSTHTVYEVPML